MPPELVGDPEGVAVTDCSPGRGRGRQNLGMYEATGFDVKGEK